MATRGKNKANIEAVGGKKLTPRDADDGAWL